MIMQNRTAKYLMISKSPFIWKPCLWTFPHKDCIPKVNSALQDLTGLTMPHFWGLLFGMRPTQQKQQQHFVILSLLWRTARGMIHWAESLKKIFLSGCSSWPVGRLVGRGFPFSSTSRLCLPEMSATAIAKNGFLYQISTAFNPINGVSSSLVAVFPRELVSIGCLFTAAHCTWILSPLSWSSNYACALFTDICAKTLFPKGFPTWNSTKLPENERQSRGI